MNLSGKATGIGSLPHTDAAAAVDQVFKYLPHIPFWPQLPQRDFREGMVAQFSENIPCLKVTPEGVLFDDHDQDNKLERFYESIINQDLDYFKISPDYAAGFYQFCECLDDGRLRDAVALKCHVTGPITFAASINNQQKVALLYDEVFLEVVVKALIMKALWQIKLLRRFGKKIIVFFDEPYLGCFGSAYTPLDRPEVIKILAEFTAGVKAQDVLIGVHCCGNTDWSIFTDTASIDIINFDAFAFLDKFMLYSGAIKSFLERKGLLCWGIVPTQEFSSATTVKGLLSKLTLGLDNLQSKGISRDLLKDSLLFSPSCGMGALDKAKAEGILKLLSEISAQIIN